MRSASVTSRRHVNFAWIGLGISDELGNTLCGKSRLHHHDAGLAADAHDGRNITNEIQIELFIKCRVDRIRRIYQEQGVAVRRCVHDCLHSDSAAGAGTVLDDEWLPESL